MRNPGAMMQVKLLDSRLHGNDVILPKMSFVVMLNQHLESSSGFRNKFGVAMTILIAGFGLFYDQLRGF